VPLLGFGHGWFIAHLCDAALEESVYQGRLADVRDSHDQHAQRFRAAVAMRSERLTELGYIGGIARMMTRKGHDADPLLLVEQVEPGTSDDRVGRISLVGLSG